MKTDCRSLIFTILFTFSGSFISAQDATTLLQNMDDLMQAPNDKSATVQIILRSKSGKEKIREAVMKQKGKDRRLYRYTQPESQAGIATLSLPDDVMWMYLPAFGKPKKISLLAKSQKFTGTDFSYEDMESKPYSEKYTPALIESTTSSFKLELIPLSNKSKYIKIVLTLDKTHYYPIQMDYYDRGDKHFKTATYKYRKGDPYWYAEEVVMTDLKKQHSTSIIMTGVTFDQGIPDEEFLVENLGQKEEEE